MTIEAKEAVKKSSLELRSLMDRLKAQSAIRHPSRPWSEETYWNIAFEWMGKEKLLLDRVTRLENGETI